MRSRIRSHGRTFPTSSRPERRGGWPVPARAVRLRAASSACIPHAVPREEGITMSAEFEQGFFVRVPAWHGLGTVLDDYPGREEAMRLAGHDWDIVELPSFTAMPYDHPLVGMAQAGTEFKSLGNGY